MCCTKPRVKYMWQLCRRLRRHRRSFVPTLEQLGSLPLHEGQNTIEFAFGRERERAFVYLLPWNARLVISDVDG